MLCRVDGSGQITITGLAPGGPAEASGRVFVGDVLVCLTNKKPHAIDRHTDIEYVKRKIQGQPKTTCRLTLVRNGSKFEVVLTRGGFSQPANAVPQHGQDAETVALPGVEGQTGHQLHATGANQQDEARHRTSGCSSVSRTSGGVTCGVGLLPSKDVIGNIVVAGVAPGGPADLSGQVMVGDCIVSLKNKKDHVLTRATSLDYVKRKLKGLSGSACILTLLRTRKVDTIGGQFQVRLVRARFTAPDGAATMSPMLAGGRRETSGVCSSGGREVGAADVGVRAATNDKVVTAAAAMSGPQKRAIAQVDVPRVQSIRSAAGRKGFGAQAPYCGVGIEYVLDYRKGGGCLVTGIARGSVAEQVGAFEVGDYLWKVDGTELKGLRNEAIRSLLTGPVGTKVEITVLKKRLQWAPHTVCLARFPSRSAAFCHVPGHVPGPSAAAPPNPDAPGNRVAVEDDAAAALAPSMGQASAPSYAHAIAGTGRRARLQCRMRD